MFLLICWGLSSALMFLHSTAERHYFTPEMNLTWEDARNHCQACFKDLVTLTPENIQAISRRLKSDHWIGLRKNFKPETNSTGNTTDYDSDESSLDSSSYSMDNLTSNSTDNSTTLSWTRWANGDPLSFQNWYPGWPVFKTFVPKRDCCSCSCTCPAKPTTTMSSFTRYTQFTTTQNTLNATNSTSTTNSSSRSGPRPNTTTTPFTTADPYTTTEPPIEATCSRSPMPTPEVPEVEDKYIEDSCVAMLSFGPWIEKNCLEELPFICYDDDLLGEVNVTNVTSNSATVTWKSAGDGFSHYQLRVKQDNTQTYKYNRSHDNLIGYLDTLTSGTQHKVMVFPVKCDRELHPWTTSFHTIPKKVTNLNYTMVTETSVCLTWSKPDGGLDFYLVKFENQMNKSYKEEIKVENLTPGTNYTFTIITGLQNISTQSEESYISVITKPGKVSNISLIEKTSSMCLTWNKPKGGVKDYVVWTMYNSKDIFNETIDAALNEINLPTGSKITFTVAARNQEDVRGENETYVTYTRPDPVENLILNSTSSTITASWTFRKDSSVSFIVELDGQTKDSKTQTVTNHFHTFDKLKTAVEYTVIVKATIGGICGDPVNNSIFTSPEPPSDPKATDRTKNSITFEWTPPKNAGHETEYSVTISSSFWISSESDSVKDTNYTFGNLTSGTNYTFKVSTIADGKESDPVSTSACTESDKREVILSVMCSSSESLLCDKNTTRENLFKQWKAHYEKLLGDQVFWELHQLPGK